MTRNLRNKKSWCVAAVLPTFNRKEKLDIILTQLCTQKGTDDIKLEIIVCVDGSSDGTDEMIKKKFPSVHTVSGDGNWWYTKSMNMGFQYAQQLNPDFVLTMNDDIEVDEIYIRTLLFDFVSQNDKNLILGSLSISNDQNKLIHFAGIKKYEMNGLRSVYYIPSLKVAYNNRYSGIYLTQELPGRGMLIPNDILVSLGFFDENFPQYGSDTDFCFRARKAGNKVMISWNAIVKVNLQLTRIRVDAKKDSIQLFIKDLFDRNSHYSIRKYTLFQYRHYGILNVIWSTPFYVLATLWSLIKKSSKSN